MAHAEEKQFDPAALGEPGAGLYRFLESTMYDGRGDLAWCRYCGKNYGEPHTENCQINNALTAARAHAAKPEMGMGREEAVRELSLALAKEHEVEPTEEAPYYRPFVRTILRELKERGLLAAKPDALVDAAREALVTLDNYACGTPNDHSMQEHAGRIVADLRAALGNRND